MLNLWVFGMFVAFGFSTKNNEDGEISFMSTIVFCVFWPVFLGMALHDIVVDCKEAGEGK